MVGIFNLKKTEKTFLNRKKIMQHIDLDDDYKFSNRISKLRDP